ncbi:QacE family quaternary ammonium compound efflux SMR transporter [Frigidibacter albus]|uniref:Guanidinium exporter n=1 Tax=Frigidibacter albus TaxID=1465486 RepID=A0A6L8VDU9_9RHOB|nr:multidrug efflux SMR transporter [Frigidibacter albus]MZQ87866.1 QacE family quaternary ammonium compound efflux SMR transporter [Frigidibacter albus]NBE29772.1 QacE family quaternary ammonium compound efflux SMR transporter [Frigidibacter albus]GGH42845.1 QacE family quaternary ammonium compound efflux SMR transporter [Frigidibacter albus]
MPTNPWALVLIAGVLEVGWALGLKWSDGFTKLVPTALTIIGALASFFLLAQAMKSLPVGTAYAVWTGIGALGTATLGMALFGEPATLVRIAGVALIVSGIIALKLA